MKEPSVLIVAFHKEDSNVETSQKIVVPYLQGFPQRRLQVNCVSKEDFLVALNTVQAKKLPRNVITVGKFANQKVENSAGGKMSALINAVFHQTV